MIEPNDRAEPSHIDRSAPNLDTCDVRAFLLAHPDFIINDPELLNHIMPARNEGANVVDMQSFVITRLQGKVRMLRDIQSDLIEASSLNSLAREQVHVAAISMLDAPSFDALMEYITLPDGLARTLGLASASICIEVTGELSRADTIGMRLLESGGVDRMMGGDLPYRLSPNVQGSPSLYGDRANNVCSEALVRLDFSRVTPPGLLALGGIDPEQFHPEQAADLLEFLAQIVERCVRLWLDLPPKA